MWQQLLVTIRWSGQTHWKSRLTKYFEALLVAVSNGLMLPFGAQDDFTHAPPLWCEPYLTKLLPGVQIQTPFIVPCKNAINCTFSKMDVWDVGLKISAIQLHRNVPGCSVWLLSAATFSLWTEVAFWPTLFGVTVTLVFQLWAVGWPNAVT